MAIFGLNLDDVLDTYPKDGRVESIRVFFRANLIYHSKEKPINEIDYNDISVSKRDIMIKEGFVIFIDDNGETKLLKNRYGNRGIINK